MSTQLIRNFLASKGVNVQAEGALSAEEKEQYRGIITSSFGVSAEVVETSYLFLDALPLQAYLAVTEVEQPASAVSVEEPVVAAPVAEPVVEPTPPVVEPEAPASIPEVPAETPSTAEVAADPVVTPEVPAEDTTAPDTDTE